ncbi:hypothetical protein ELI_1610 [Eubacterium callanderi]|uniref:Uncharacterized protein n=1 Tax=Eubacterium callanderi TaxID=53442 RepID=E3GM26_9FIRM|nr:hypothetical protein ELI_1610 [Eubacterium callanderi]
MKMKNYGTNLRRKFDYNQIGSADLFLHFPFINLMHKK